MMPFNYRQVAPSLSMVLVDYNRPVYEDKLLPLGRLREPVEGLARADIVIVSKCPRDISDRQQQEIKQRLNLNKQQQLYFSTIAYDRLNAAFPEKGFVSANRDRNIATKSATDTWILWNSLSCTLCQMAERT
jgi:Tetraacyldisaccharide-1-P 4''-kinase